MSRPEFFTGDGGSTDLAAIVHEEIDRLPERFRIPVVLCELEGLTHERAAGNLGWPVGTLKSRLLRARELLRGRLSRRGVALPAGAITADVISNAAEAASWLPHIDSLAEAAVSLVHPQPGRFGLISRALCG